MSLPSEDQLKRLVEVLPEAELRQLACDILRTALRAVETDNFSLLAQEINDWYATGYYYADDELLHDLLSEIERLEKEGFDLSAVGDE